MPRAVCALLVMSWLLPNSGGAQPACDPDLKVSPVNPDGYQIRADGRCEGEFVGKVSAGIRVVSVHFPSRDFQPGTSVRLEWSLPPADQVYVRAMSMAPGQFFRMDAIRPGSPRSYLWPTDVMARLLIKATDIGLLSWADVPVGGRVERVYSPVSLHDRSGEIEVVLFPEVALDEVYYSLIAVDGRAETPVIEDRPLKLGVYPPNRLVIIRLPGLESKRIYRLEIAARLKNARAVTRDLYLVNYQE